MSKPTFHVPEYVASLVPYPPGKPIEEVEREYGVSGSIKLASNENPFGPSPRAIAAISDALTGLHRYPDGGCHYLAAELADHLGVAPEQLVFGNGSNEVIEFLVKALVEPGNEVISSRPSFLMYSKLVQIRGGVNVVVDLKETGTMEQEPGGGFPFTHDLTAILDRVTERTRLVFLDNPNNPTGGIIPSSELAAFIDRLPSHVVLALDEAYIDFVKEDERPDQALCLDDPRIVFLRTFSKAYGLAGLRIGYGLMHPELAAVLHRVRQPFNVNSLAQIGARAALTDFEHYRTTLNETRAGMACLKDELVGLGCLPYGSHTNFFMVDVRADAAALYEGLLRRGVIIRPMAAYGFPELVRITVGREDENRRLVSMLAEVLRELR